VKRLLLPAAVALLVAGAPASALAAPTASEMAPGCDVVSAHLDWGLKESYRAYIDGSIANGQWEVADGATYSTPTFGFDGQGRVDLRAPIGQLDFAGSVRFTGHGGVLDTTIANPAIVFRGEEPALLLLDVSGPLMDGGEVNAPATPFVSIDLSGQDLTPVDGVVTIVDAPTTFTADGAAALPNYAAGEPFDPVNVTIDLGDCDLSGEPVGGDVIDGGDTGDGDAGGAVVAVVGGIALLGLAAVTLTLGMRRRGGSTAPDGR